MQSICAGNWTSSCPSQHIVRQCGEREHPENPKKKLSLMSLVTGSCGELVLVDGTGCKHEVVAIGERVSSEERDGSIMVAAVVLLLFEMTR